MTNKSKFACAIAALALVGASAPAFAQTATTNSSTNSNRPTTPPPPKCNDGVPNYRGNGEPFKPNPPQSNGNAFGKCLNEY